jgi:hypothetical protein
VIRAKLGRARIDARRDHGIRLLGAGHAADSTSALR